MTYLVSVTSNFITAEGTQLALIWLRISTKFISFAYRTWSLSRNHTDYVHKVKGQNLPWISKTYFTNIWQNSWHRLSTSIDLIYPGYVSCFSNEKIMSTRMRAYIFIKLKCCKVWDIWRRRTNEWNYIDVKVTPWYACARRECGRCVAANQFQPLVMSTTPWPH
jgi:hypothetical protein